MAAIDRIPIGVIGDSDSQSYQRGALSPPGASRAGGRFHAATFQWPEVLARIREKQVDLGQWGLWGLPRWRSFGRLRDAMGLRWRAPQKEDYRHNFAWPSGCSDLFGGGWRQVPRLVELMDENPERWHRGVVVIRMGVNDFGKESLDALAADSRAPEVRKTMDYCIGEINRAVAFIRSKHPDACLVLVGIFDNAHWAFYRDKYRSGTAIANIAHGLDYFDDALRSMCRRDAKLAFFDDRAFFADHWGTRDADGQPAYETVAIGERLKATHSAGDSPDNAVLADGHAGSVANALWVQALVDLMRSSFRTPIDAISDAEVVEFIDRHVVSS